MSIVDLRVKFCGRFFRNPFILAASPSTDSKEMIARGFVEGWAGAVLKTTSPNNDVVEINYPILSSLHPGPGMIGLQNIDLISERHIDEIASDVVWLKARFPDHRVIVSIMAGNKSDWQELVRKSEQAGADLVELSISCPQGSMIEEEKAEGWMISQDPALTEKITRWACNASNKMPIYVKISSNVTNIKSIAQAVECGGGQGICAIDSPEGIVGVDLENFSPLPSVQGYSSRGGFTGRAIKPIALRCVADIAETVHLPISGVGGIYDWRDAIQFLLLGASTVQVCTAVMHKGFHIINDLCDGMTRWLEEKKYSNPMEIVGLSLPRLKNSVDLPHGIKVVSMINQDTCIRCGLCFVACADGGHDAIKFLENRLVTVDEMKCVGCALCAQVCPVPDCISIKNC